MAKAKQQFNFDEAYQELESILEEIQSNDSINGLEAKVSRASELLEACKTKLRTIEGTISNTLSDDK